MINNKIVGSGNMAEEILDPTLLNNMRMEYQYRETEDLLDIWQKHDLDSWKVEVFDVIRQILIDRKVEIPPFDNSSEADIHLDQAEKYLNEDDGYKALIESDAAIQLAPHYGYAHYIKAVSLEEVGKEEEAIQFYKQALELDPALQEARIDLHSLEEEVIRKNVTEDERFLAAISHASIILFPIGFFVALNIWISQKHKSRYVAGQARQATIFQLIVGVYLFLANAGLLIMFIIDFIKDPSKGNLEINNFFFVISFFILFFFVVMGLVAAVRTYKGKPFNYFGSKRFINKHNE